LAGGSAGPIKTFDISSLESAEVYYNAAQIPMEFSGSGTTCGVLILWSRQE
jgi:hypothetical protein